MAVSVSYNPTPSTPLGFTARVAPSCGGQATSGAEAQWETRVLNLAFFDTLRHIPPIRS